jgi:hypothetical protein
LKEERKPLSVRREEGLHVPSANLEEVLLSMTCCIWLHRKQCFFWEANSHLAITPVHQILGIPIPHHFVHKNQPLLPVQRQMHPLIVCKICFNIAMSFSHRASVWIFPSGLPNKNDYGYILFPVNTTFPAHFTLFLLLLCNNIRQRRFAYKLWSSSLCHFPYRPLLLPFSCVHIFTTVFFLYVQSVLVP